MKHFYSVYDFDRDTVSLGINKHSEGKVSMYKPGDRPVESVKGLMQAKKIDMDVDDDDDDFIQTTKK